MCFRWLHIHCNRRYSKLNTLFTIPVIIISTITGTANFAQKSFPEEYRSMISMAIGALNITAGMITTIQQFMKVSELNEAHRVSSISWGKFNRLVKVELSKKPEERQNVTQFIKTCNDSFDLLMETSPMIRKEAIDSFKATFKKLEKNIIGENKVIRPDICETALTSTSDVVYHHEHLNNADEVQILDILNKNKILIEKTNIVREFRIKFIKINNRKPTETEVFENLQGDMDHQILRSICLVDVQEDSIV